MNCPHSYARDCSECNEPVCKRYLNDTDECPEYFDYDEFDDIPEFLKVDHRHVKD